MSNIFNEELIQRAEDMLYGQEDGIIGLASDLGVVSDEEWDLCMLKRKIVHSTKEAAIAHSKAMLGIDPEYFKD